MVVEPLAEHRGSDAAQTRTAETEQRSGACGMAAEGVETRAQGSAAVVAEVETHRDSVEMIPVVTGQREEAMQDSGRSSMGLVLQKLAVLRLWRHPGRMSRGRRRSKVLLAG